MQKREIEAAIISDVHLGTHGCHATELINYLQKISPKLLILNGDIIDGWQFNKRYFPPAHLQVIKEILTMIETGTRVVYITGNHDEMLRRYSNLQLNNFQLLDKLVVEINGKTTWIFHGDVFDRTTTGSAKIIAKLGGYGYDLLIICNRFVNWSLKKIGKPKMSFSKKIKSSVKKAVLWINNFEQTAAELAIEKKYDYVICGHIHQPQIKKVSNKNGSVIYMNSGDWVENLTALEFVNDAWTIYQYNETDYEKATVIPIRKKIPVLNVITDEIGLIINSIQ